MTINIIPVLIAEDHSIKHRIMEDISNKILFEQGKGTGTPSHLQFASDYVTRKLSSRTSLFSSFNLNFKICFCSKLLNFLYMLARDNDAPIMVVECFSFDNQQQKYTKIETYK